MKMSFYLIKHVLKTSVIIAVLSALLFPFRANSQTKLLRFPDVCKDKIVFCYAGDLWLVQSSGGTASRLTAHPGLELFPKYSPDGRWIAFTGQYDGDEQVYVIPANGGIPRQLTFYPARGPLPPRWGYDNQVYGWTPDGSSILFRSLRDGWDLTDSRLFAVSIKGGLPEPLPMPVSGAGDLSPDGRRAVYSPLVRDFRTWKRYQGGWAQDLYIFNLADHEAEKITDSPRSDRDPMWIGDKIYFTSDRDGKLNIYQYDTKSKETKQITHEQTWDVRWPSADEEGSIVYELDGELNVMNTQDGQSKRISIFVPNDGVAMRPSHISAAKQIEGWSLSPKGERALFSARGDIFSVPAEKGPTRNITNSSGAHDKRAAWSPEGSKVAFISDADGEEEIYIIDQDGSGEAVQLTDGGNAMRYNLQWAGNGDRIAFSDKNGKLFVLNVKTKKLILAAEDKGGGVFDYEWSPNGGFLAFSLMDPNTFRSLYVWSVKDEKLHRITGELFNEFNPAWGADGKFLYYLSDREYAPQIGSLEWNYAVDRETCILALALKKDLEHPFAPESDEVDMGNKDGEKKGKKDEKKDKKEKEKAKKFISIDFDGLSARVARVPVEADNYYGLSAVKDYLVYVKGAPFFYGRSSGRKSDLKIYSFKKRKEHVIAEGISRYALSHDGSRVLVRQNGKFNLLEVKPKSKDSKKTISTKKLEMDRIPSEEWSQIFDEVWRRYRDFFYVDNMHGYDWMALREQYRPLLKFVAHRSDLNYVIGEMIAELSVSHAYIGGGDFELPDRPEAALPGARFVLDKKAGRYKITRIYEGQNEEDIYRSPLTEIGIKASVGDYVLAVDGRNLTADMNPYKLLLHKSDRPVELTLSADAKGRKEQKIKYNPVTSERNLVYLNWVNNNRRRVDEKTQGRIGYLHIPDMGSKGIREFIKWYYGQIRKEGLIVDVRGNGGGNVSQMLIERLGRKLLSVDYSRNSSYPSTYPSVTFAGKMVCLLNETSASDGDIFPAMFKKAGLGKLIGKRSWGGVIGISGHGPLIDGGYVYVPEFGFVSTGGDWIIENHGVDPDIIVENDPKSVILGRDQQLERGIEEVLKAVEKNPTPLPKRPRPPVKTH